MASLNSSHHQDGGVLLYSGEIVLLYCDKVNCDIEHVGNTNGRIFLTTHRVVFTSQPINQNSRLQSLAAPFYAMFDLGLEQPVFGSNYIRGKVRTNSQQNTSPLTQNQFSFKLKFNKGGAVEFGRALTSAAKAASQNASSVGFNVYSFVTTPAAGQYYQAPSNVYQPNYQIGFALPTQMFNEAPQAGTIYHQNAPPPYPGIIPAHQTQQQPGFVVGNPYTQVYPAQPVNPIYENSAYNSQFRPPSQTVPNVHYPAQPPMQQPGYAPQSNQAPPAYQVNNYPNYPQNQASGYQPQATSNNNSNYQSQYPQVNQQQPGYVPQPNTTYPNIPSYEDSINNRK